MFPGFMSPAIRILGILLAMIGALICPRWYVLLVGWLVMLAAASARTEILRQLVWSCALILAPTTIGLIVVWGYLVGAPPSHPIHSDPIGGLAYALLVASRLLFLFSLLQTMLASLPNKELLTTLYTVGVRGEAFLIALGATAVTPEILLRTIQIYDACKARGFLRKLGVWDRLRVLPYLVRGVFAWTLRSAHQRADTWESRQILDELKGWSWTGRRSPVREWAWIVLTTGFLAVSICARCFS